MQSSGALRVARVGHQSKHVYIEVCMGSDETDTPRASPRRRVRSVWGTRGVGTKMTERIGDGGELRSANIHEVSLFALHHCLRSALCINWLLNASLMTVLSFSKTVHRCILCSTQLLQRKAVNHLSPDLGLWPRNSPEQLH